ncbi:hypothetical protein CRG98_042465 [Punica granatum]|uniref:Peptidase A1 domain-containing protein n=1 Tax=Punica granatum TaxID=22663 RepID=A0A2I0I048_PUNGR|nr:hypothetical protein CRG98_042465 [Punica granatum]
MATTSHQYTLRLFVLSCALVGSVLCKDLQADTYHTIEVSSLLPSASCKHSATKGDAKASSLKVVHKFGPCASLRRLGPSIKQPTHADILREDQSRVNWINSRLTSKVASVVGPNQVGQSDVNIPAKSGSTVGSGNYVCKPCVKYCYEQKEPIFDSKASTSYGNISCTSSACSQLSSATGNNPGCSSSACVYGIQYGDTSYSVGKTGHLTFGKGTSAGTLKFTPLSTISEGASFYGITIQGISVGGKKLSIPASTFSNVPGIIDSGTVITRLPPTAYTALRNAFRQLMTKYPTAPALSILDTCYDFSNYSSVFIPEVGFSFSGAVEVNLDRTGTMYTASTSQVCLAFAANSDDTDVLIYGNVQQQTFEVVYDVGAMKLGFAPKGCA